MHKNCLLKHVIEENIEGKRRGGRRRRKQLLDDLKGERRYWNLKKKALGLPLLRTAFARGYGPVARQTAQ
jgi:hypothetical protein